MTEPHISQPYIRQRSKVSPIWFIPFIALLLFAYLVYRNMAESGIEITIAFPSGAGIIEGKTQIQYRGLQLGVVKEIAPNRTLDGVIVTAEMDRKAEAGLTSAAQFWLVHPQASLTRISGLETIFSGNYIGVSLSEDGEDTSQFEALAIPPLEMAPDSLVVRLRATEMGSISVGSPVYYRKTEVGEVMRTQLSPQQDDITIEVSIQPQYRELVNSATRFWNTSGISFSADLSGVEIQTTSLASVIAGGIAFETPAGDHSAYSHDAILTLYPDYAAAHQGIQLQLATDSSEGIKPHSSKIKYLGTVIGQVDALSLDPHKKQVTIKAQIEPDLAPLIGDDTLFYLIKPEIGLQGVQHVDTLLTGYHIGIQPGAHASDKRAFKLHNVLPAEANALPIRLFAQNIYGVHDGVKIYHRGMVIGQVTATQFDPSGTEVQVDALIDSRFKHHVRKNTRFYVNAGFELGASVRGLTMRAESMASVIEGGISLFTPEADSPAAEQNERFFLYMDREEASFKNSLLTERFYLKAEKLFGLQVNAPVTFREMPVGHVSGYHMDETQHIQVHIEMQQEYTHLINRSSRFWNISGIEVDASLTGIDVKADSLLSIAAGGIAFETPDLNSSPLAKDERSFSLFESRAHALGLVAVAKVQFGLQHTVKRGMAIKWEQQQIGEVVHVELLPQQNTWLATIELNEPFAQQVLIADSEFWYQPGPRLSLRHLEQAADALAGDFIAVKPGHSQSEQLEFAALQNLPQSIQQQGLNIYLHAQQKGSLNPGDSVYYRQVEVGTIEALSLFPNGEGVRLDIRIFAPYIHLLRKNSRFWHASGVNASFGILSGLSVHAESLDSLLHGGIAFDHFEQKPHGKIQPESRFRLYASAREAQASQ